MLAAYSVPSSRRQVQILRRPTTTCPSPLMRPSPPPTSPPVTRSCSCAMPPRSNLRSLALYAVPLLPRTFSSGTSPLPRLDPSDLDPSDLDQQLVSQVCAVRSALTARADHQPPISRQMTPMQARTFGQHLTHQRGLRWRGWGYAPPLARHCAPTLPCIRGCPTGPIGARPGRPAPGADGPGHGPGRRCREQWRIILRLLRIVYLHEYILYLFIYFRVLNLRQMSWTLSL